MHSPKPTCSPASKAACLERDDEDLAIEQLPSAGGVDDPEPTGSSASATNLTRLAELREHIEHLQAQLEALPTRALQRIEDLDARAFTLSSQHEQLIEWLAELSESARDTVEGAALNSGLETCERELNVVLGQRGTLEREIGNPAEARRERDELERAITQAAREQTQGRDELAEREVRSPEEWVRATLGGRPDDSRAGEAWERGVREVARYRLQYAITDQQDPLGAHPQRRDQERDWGRAQRALHRAASQLGRDRGNELDSGQGVDIP